MDLSFELKEVDGQSADTKNKGHILHDDLQCSACYQGCRSSYPV
jgi:hypothetical protein